MKITSLALAALAAFSPLPSAAADDVTECDRLAASPDDPGRTAPGVALDTIDGTSAEAACGNSAAASPDIARFAFQLGRALERQQRYDAARQAYGRAMDQGYAIAARAIGNLYEYGLGTRADGSKAAGYYQRALDGGFIPAAADLGSLYERGIGVKVDEGRAVRLYRLAAEAGDASGQVHLGYLYQFGTGVPQSDQLAVKYYRAAADQGYAVGQFDLALMYADGTGVEKDIDAAIRLLRLAADQGDANALLELARYASDGTGMKIDEAEAERLFRLAIDAGNDEIDWQAKNELAWMWALDSRNLDEAAVVAAESLALVPPRHEDRASILDTNAWIAHLRRDDLKALEYQEEAISDEDDYAPFHDRLGDILAGLGRHAEAVAEWNTSLRLPAPDPEGDWDRLAVFGKLGPPPKGSAAPERTSTEPSIRPTR